MVKHASCNRKLELLNSRLKSVTRHRNRMLMDLARIAKRCGFESETFAYSQEMVAAIDDALDRAVRIDPVVTRPLEPSPE